MKAVLGFVFGAALLALAVAGHHIWDFHTLVSVVLGVVGITIACTAIGIDLE